MSVGSPSRPPAAARSVSLPVSLTRHYQTRAVTRTVQPARQRLHGHVCDTAHMTVLMRHPIMIVRARLDPTVLAQFESWHQQTHLPHVLEIPGIVSAFRVRAADPIAGAHLMGYTFEDEEVVQPALSSEEAQIARRDWDRWAEQVYELSVEIYAPLQPLPIFQHHN